jgi:uncharacterized protein (TIGR03437 family)
MQATCSGTVIIYKAAGNFGANVISGPDTLKLAGQPYSVVLNGCTTATPTKTGSDYAEYYPIQLTGTVKSQLLIMPYTIPPTPTAFIITVPTTGTDNFEFIGNVTIAGSTINVKASIAVPLGTVTSTTIAPFSSVKITTSKSEFIYTQGTSPTALSVTGTGSATVYTPPAKVTPKLQSESVQVITSLDGVHTVQDVRNAPIDPAATTGRTFLQFYASGVRDAAEVRVQVGGQNVPVLYSGASGHFDGLDEVMVEIPRSLTGMGDVEAILTVDGQTAEPVHIHIQ